MYIIHIGKAHKNKKEFYQFLARRGHKCRITNRDTDPTDFTIVSCTNCRVDGDSCYCDDNQLHLKNSIVAQFETEK